MEDFSQSMDNVIYLKFGDTSGDGHEKTEVLGVRTNVSRDTFNVLMHSPKVKKMFDINTECAEYEETSLSVKCTKALKKAGLITIDNDIERYDIGYGMYPYLLLKVVKHCYPQFEYMCVEFETIDIGGYGVLG